MKIYLVKYIKDGTIEGAFTDIDTLIETYAQSGFVMKGRQLYETNTGFDNPIYRITTTELRGMIKYNGKVEL